MNNQEIKNSIKHLRDIQRLSFPQIAEKLGISRVTCSRIYSGKVQSIRPRNQNLEQFKHLILQWYDEHPSLRASQVYERLKVRGYKNSYPSVVLFTRSLRAKRLQCYFPLTFEPAEEAQVDWFHISHPTLGQLAGFALVLSFSRLLFVRIFPRMSFEFFIEGHLQAFSFLNGITHALRYDNLKSVVIKRHPLTYNTSFLEFAHYYSFEIRLCNPRAGNEKGRVERAIRTIRESFLNTADHHQSLRALNSAMAQWLTDKNLKPHRTTEIPPVILSKREKLRTLPINPWINRIVHPPKLPTKTGLILFDTNQYSVPDYLVGHPLQVHAFCDKIEILDAKERSVAAHPRSFERNKTFMNPLHRSFSRISSRTKAERILSIIKKLDPVVDRFIALNEHTGEDPLQTAYALFNLIRSHCRLVVISAVREALSRNIHRSNFVSSLINGKNSAPYQETVHPQNKQLLSINYKPRPLKEYD